MKPARANVLDAENFHESEVQLALLDVEPRIATWMKFIFEGLLLYSLFGKAKTTSGMDVQNISRKTQYRNWVVAVFLLTSLIKIPLLQSWLERYKDRLDRFNSLADLLKFSSLLLFISGRLPEIRPLYNAVGSTPTVAEPATQRAVSLELVTRFLTLQSISSIALLVAPWIHLRRLVSTVTRKLSPSSIKVSTCSSCGSETLVRPQTADPCGDVYCYYCISSENVPFSCFRCSQSVVSFQPSI